MQQGCCARAFIRHFSMSLMNNIRDCMDHIVQFVLPFICNPTPLKVFSYLLVALVHFLVLWSQHVFMWNSRFDCRGSGCPASSNTVMIAECAVLYVLLLLLLVSYWRCILTPLALIPFHSSLILHRHCTLLSTCSTTVPMLACPRRWRAGAGDDSETHARNRRGHALFNLFLLLKGAHVVVPQM